MFVIRSHRILIYAEGENSSFARKQQKFLAKIEHSSQWERSMPSRMRIWHGSIVAEPMLVPSTLGWQKRYQ